MDYDVVLVIGMAIGLFAIPSLMSAWVDGRAPRVAVGALSVAAALVLLAVWGDPEGYSLGGVPHVLVDVLARYLL